MENYIFKKNRAVLSQDGTVGGLVVGFEGAGEFAETVIGAAEDILGSHPLVGIAMFIEIRRQEFCQRVVEHRLTTAVLLLQRLQLLAHLRTIARATGHQPQGAQTQKTIYQAISLHLCKDTKNTETAKLSGYYNGDYKQKKPASV